ncbi:TetR/AcrR family transcriptional regulator [Cytobacillus suaedae]|nr:TetR/AcrR family transcriptional regulator [Cytobacillus suaedae]
MIKKQLIMEKAIELFATQGFEATSVQQITEHCGISKGAFYLSFKSKDELIIALIDHFMIQIITDIDHMVKKSEDSNEILYKFYYSTYHSFHKHSDFAKMFMKEQTQTFNPEFISRTRYYDSLIDKIILTMIERLYGDSVRETKYDLLFCIKGFMRTYSELFLFYNVTLDLNLLSKSLVEKTNLLAKHTSIPFISKELMKTFELSAFEEVTKEQILEVLEQKLAELTDSIEKESITLLKQHISEPNLSPAMIKGLIENIRNHPHCKSISYLLDRYFQF